MGGDDRRSRSRRRRSRSRRHHRRDEEQPPAGDRPALGPPPAGAYPPPPMGAYGGPPPGWNGPGGYAPPPPHLGMPPHGYPPPPHGYPPPPGVPPHGGPEPIYDTAYESYGHYGSSALSAVAPPPSLDASSQPRKGKGGKKGYHKGSSWFSEQPPAERPPDGGLVAANIPEELNTLEALNRHFRQFGEIVKITTNSAEGKAFVQFKEFKSLEAALPAVVLEKPEITLTPLARATPSKGKGKSPGKAAVRDDRAAAAPAADNHVLVSNPALQSKLDESKKKVDDIKAMKSKLLGALTEQMKTIMMKLREENVTEVKQEQLRTLLMEVKSKMDKISPTPAPPAPAPTPAPGSADDAEPTLLDSATPAIEGASAPPSAAKGKGKGKGKEKDGDFAKGKGKFKGKDFSKGKGKSKPFKGKMVLDLRPSILRVYLTEEMTLETVSQELKKHATAEDQVVDVRRPDDSTAGENGGLALVELSDRKTAELFFSQRSKMPFTAEWADKPPGWTPPTHAPSPRKDSGMLDASLAATLAADNQRAPPKLAPAADDDGETDLDRLVRLGGVHSPPAKMAAAVAFSPSPRAHAFSPIAAAAPVAPAVFGAAVKAPVQKEQKKDKDKKKEKKERKEKELGADGEEKARRRKKKTLQEDPFGGSVQAEADARRQQAGAVEQEEVARTARPKRSARPDSLGSPHVASPEAAAAPRLTEAVVKAFTAANGGDEGLLMADPELRSVSPISAPGVTIGPGGSGKKKKRRKPRPDAGSEEQEDPGRKHKKRKDERNASASPSGDGKVKLRRR